MELLERDRALATLNAARDAASSGQGRVVLVTGEPGIGKTWLVRQFLNDLDPRTRVLVGTCDDLSIPRPLGPLRDLAGSVSRPLAEALSEGAAPHDIQTLLIEELEHAPSPTVLVLEDVHWADDATLDSIIVLGRRIKALPAMLVLTFRGGEASPGHRLHATLGAIRAEDTEVVELEPLSEQAVIALAGENAAKVYTATRGNPFYVSELLASRTVFELPPSVANAVLGRASRLDESARRLVELISVVPSRVKTSLLDEVMPDWASSAEEPERIQLLEVDADYVRFRHELARNAIRSSVPIAGRRRLHAQFLTALLAANADPADIVHHAEAAGADDVTADYALVAARRAAALESNREAYAHYLRASAFSATDGPKTSRRSSSKSSAMPRTSSTGSTTRSSTSSKRSIRTGISATRPRSADARVCCRGCTGSPAMGSPRTRQRWRRYRSSVRSASRSSSLVHTAGCRSWPCWPPMSSRLCCGETELCRWQRALGDESTRVHALVNLGAAKAQLGLDAIEELEVAHQVADAAGERYEAARALNNLAYTSMCWGQPDLAMRFAQRTFEYADAHEVHNLASYSSALIAWLLSRAGEWDEAERLAQGEIDKGITVTQLLAKTVLAELAVRRGDPDATDRLKDLSSLAERTGELQRITPLLELTTEYALTRDEPMPTDRFLEVIAEFGPYRLVGWGALRIGAWAAVAGIDLRLEESSSTTPFAPMSRKDWRAAADAFGDVGWNYDRALMLSMLDDEEALIESIEIARRLGAQPLIRRVTRRMRELAIRVPQGQRESTRSNPAGLTARQVEVLALVAEGLTNAEIADRLVVSQRTAEHHVAALFTKLGVATRREAAQRASELGLTAPT